MASSDGFSAEEKAAIKERARELKAQAKQADLTQALLDTIAEMPKAEREMAEKIHAIITEHAPGLTPKNWYGMPGWARDGAIVVFFQSAEKFTSRYSTLGFNDPAQLDDGNMWPTAYALTSITATEEATIVKLVKKAAG